MKKLAAIVLGLSLMTGCMHQASAPTPPIPGANNAFDSNTYQVLVTAHGIAKSLSDQAKAGTYKPVGAEKVAVNQFINDENAAQILYKAYKAGTVTQDQMQDAVTKVANDQANLPAGVK